MMFKLRDNFDLLLKMFWHYEGAKPWIREQLIMLEAAQQAALLDGRQDMKLKLKRGGAGETPLIDEEYVDELFLKGNMKLVCDVWNHILDVVEQGLLLNDEEWGKRMLSSTCIILAWYITSLFQLPDPKGFMEGAVTSGGIEVSDKTRAIHKGDLKLSQQWPALRIPLKWGKRTNVPWFGELVGGKGLVDTIREDLETELVAASAAAMTATGVGSDDGGKKVEYLLKIMENGFDSEAESFKDTMLSRADDLEVFGMKALEKFKQMKEKAMEVNRGMKDSKIYTEKLVKLRAATDAVEQFCKSAWTAFEEAKRHDKQAELEGNETGTEALEVIGSYHVWMENLKKMRIFKDLGMEYEESFRAPVSRSVMHLGNSSGIGQAMGNPHPGVLHSAEFQVWQAQQVAAFYAAHQHMLIGGGSHSGSYQGNMQSFPMLGPGPQITDNQRALGGNLDTKTGGKTQIGGNGNFERNDNSILMTSVTGLGESRATSVGTSSSGLMDTENESTV